MSTAFLKEIISRLFNILQDASLPMHEGIEQLATLLYLKLLDEQDDARLATGQPKLFDGSAARYRWRNWQAFAPEETERVLRDGVFPYLASMVRSESLVGDYFRSVQLSLSPPRVLAGVVSEISELCLADMTNGERGLLFDELISAGARHQEVAEHVTPPRVRHIMIALAQPTPCDTILDPCCGLASLLADATGYATDQRSIVAETTARATPPMQVTGFEQSWPIARLARLHMIMRGFTGHEITCGNALSPSGGLSAQALSNGFSLVLASPPFGAKPYFDNVRPELSIESSQSELLYLALAQMALAPGGRAVVLVPDGVLSGTTEAHLMLRHRMLGQRNLLAVVSLGTGAFMPHSGIKTSLLVFRNSDQPPYTRTDRVWFYEVPLQHPSKQAQRENIDCPAELLRAWDSYANSNFTAPPGVPSDILLDEDDPEPQGWWADLSTIAKKGHTLVASSYKPKRKAPQADPELLNEQLMPQLGELEAVIHAWHPRLVAPHQSLADSPAVLISSLIEEVPTFNPTSKPETMFNYAETGIIDRERHIITTRPVLGCDISPRARRLLRTGDVVITTIRPATVGAAFVPPECDGAVASGDLCILRARSSDVAPEFLLQLCLQSDFVRQLEALTSGATLPRVNESQIKSALVPKPPPLYLQNQLVEPIVLLRQIDEKASSAVKTARELQQAMRANFFAPATHFNS